MSKMKFHISNAKSEKRNLFYLWHIRHGSKKYVIIMSTPIAETSEKSIFAESSESGQTSSPQFVRFPFFRLAPAVVEKKKKRGSTPMANEVIRETLKEFNVKQWELAAAIGVSEQTMVRRMRFEMPDEVQLHLLEVIEKVAAKKREVA